MVLVFVKKYLLGSEVQASSLNESTGWSLPNQPSSSTKNILNQYDIADNH